LCRQCAISVAAWSHRPPKRSETRPTAFKKAVATIHGSPSRMYIPICKRLVRLELIGGAPHDAQTTHCEVEAMLAAVRWVEDDEVCECAPGYNGVLLAAGCSRHSECRQCGVVRGRQAGLVRRGGLCWVAGQCAGLGRAAAVAMSDNKDSIIDESRQMPRRPLPSAPRLEARGMQRGKILDVTARLRLDFSTVTDRDELRHKKHVKMTAHSNQEDVLRKSRDHMNAYWTGQPMQEAGEFFKAETVEDVRAAVGKSEQSSKPAPSLKLSASVASMKMPTSGPLKLSARLDATEMDLAVKAAPVASTSGTNLPLQTLRTPPRAFPSRTPLDSPMMTSPLAKRKKRARTTSSSEEELWAAL